MKQKLFILIILLTQLLIVGCSNQNREIELQIDGGSVTIVSDGPKLKLTNEGIQIAEIVIVSNAYYVTSYANGKPSVNARYLKWESYPADLNQTVERNGDLYLISYDNEGNIRESIKVYPESGE